MQTLLSTELLKLGLTQGEMASRVKVSQSYISQVLKGKILNYDSAKKFADIFNLDLVAIMEDFDMLKLGPPKTILKQKSYDLNDLVTIKVSLIAASHKEDLRNAYFDSSVFKDLPTEDLTLEQKNLGTHFKIEVYDESMDNDSSKSLQIGDWAYCRSLPKIEWKNTEEFERWTIWAFFHYEYGIIFRSIKSYNNDNGEMILESINADQKKFPPLKINLGQCSYICNVVKKISNF